LIRRTHANIRAKRYGDVLAALTDGSSWNEIVAAVELSGDEIAEVLAVLDGPIYTIRRLRRLLLLRLDEALSEGQARYDHAVVSVEHVLPQTPASNSQWLEAFPTDEVRKLWVHRVANLALLSRKKNASAGNQEFDEKKRNYFNLEDTSPFVLTAQLRNYDVWSPQILQQGQEFLLSKLTDLWDLRAADEVSHLKLVQS